MRWRYGGTSLTEVTRLPSGPFKANQKIANADSAGIASTRLGAAWYSPSVSNAHDTVADTFFAEALRTFGDSGYLQHSWWQAVLEFPNLFIG